MNKINKLLQELISVSLIKEADIRTLRRVVILAIFNSDIPNQMEKDFKRRIASNPDPGVIKSNKKFLEQLLEDKASLVNDEEYRELQQDQQFQKLATSVNNKLISLNKANDLNFGNIAFTKPQLSKKFSYSTYLYLAAENEVKNLENYISRKYGPKFIFNLLRTKEMGPGSPETAQSGISDNVTELNLKTPSKDLDELSGAEVRNEINLDYTAEKLDSRIGTNLAFKNYVFPTGYPEDRVKEIILKGKDQDKLEAFNTLIPVNPALKNISGIKDITDIDDITSILANMVKHVPPEDIKFYVEEFIPVEKSKQSQSYEKSFRNIQDIFDIAVGWLPSGPNAMKIVDAINHKNDMIG